MVKNNQQIQIPIEEKFLEDVVQESIANYYCIDHGIRLLYHDKREERFCPFCKDD